MQNTNELYLLTNENIKLKQKLYETEKKLWQKNRESEQWREKIELLESKLKQSKISFETSLI